MTTWTKRNEPQVLKFSPLAWLKLQFFLHRGDTEIGGFGISAETDLLYITDFITIHQEVSSVSVEFADDSVADYVDACVDAGLQPRQFMRIWCHTHPGESPQPSTTDEETFARVFGSCDWSMMFIIGRTSKTYARLSFSTGPGMSVLLPVEVDYASWPNRLALLKYPESMFAGWEAEYTEHVHAKKWVSQYVSKFISQPVSPPRPVDTGKHGTHGKKWRKRQAKARAAEAATRSVPFGVTEDVNDFGYCEGYDNYANAGIDADDKLFDLYDQEAEALLQYYMQQHQSFEK